MGFWDILKRDRIPNENTTVPFFKADTPDARRNWFARTRPWHKVSPIVVNAMLGKLESQPEFSELFIVTSMKFNLIDKYTKINPTLGDTTICAVLAAMLTKPGLEAARVNVEFVQAVLTKQPTTTTRENAVQLGSDAKDALEVAVRLEENMPIAYWGLATLLGTIGDYTHALQYARQGIASAQRMMKDSNYKLSALAEVRQGGDALPGLEVELRRLEAVFEQGMRK